MFKALLSRSVEKVEVTFIPFKSKKKKNNMYQYKITHSSFRIINVEQVPKPKNDILEKKIDKYALAKK